MTAIVGALGGILSGAATGVLDIISKDKAAKLKVAEMAAESELIKAKAEVQIDQIKAQGELDMKKAELDAKLTEGKDLRAHDAALTTDNKFIGALRASVRPVITYLFVGLFLIAKMLVIIVAANQVKNVMDLLAVSQAILDDPTIGIMATILGFWFGQRTVEHQLKKWTDAGTFRF